MKKYSFLGVALLTASAITAFVIPSKSNAKTEAREPQDGFYQPSSDGGGMTCTQAGSDEDRCSYTATGGTDLSATGAQSEASVSVLSITESATTLPGADA